MLRGRRTPRRGCCGRLCRGERRGIEVGDGRCGEVAVGLIPGEAAQDGPAVGQGEGMAVDVHGVEHHRLVDQTQADPLALMNG